MTPPPPPFGTFPKIHPFWMCKASLTCWFPNGILDGLLRSELSFSVHTV